jgi:arylsulfatase A
MRIALLSLFLTCLLACQPATEAPTPPNVILILADDLGYNDLSRYRPLVGSQADTLPQAQTPHLDQLGEMGMTFTHFYAGAAVCSPSRAALLTGRNCTRVGIYNWIPPNQPMHLRSEEVTLAEMLKPLGYQTGHFGKWHLTSEGMGQPLPNDQGFDYSFFAYNNARPSHKDPDNYFRNGEPVGKLEGYACQLVMDEALTWLEGRKVDAPFYLNVWFNEPHVKLAAPDSLTARHDFNQKYYGAIENLDLAVGRLLRYLEAQGLAEETIVLFTSDNGSQELYSNDPLRGEKCLNFEGGLRVPMMVRWPGKVPAGAISEQVGGFPDVLPTLASLTGAQLPEGRKLDGTDLSPVWRGEQATLGQRSPVFFYRYFHDPILMLREGDQVLLGYERPPYPYAERYNIKELALLKPEPGQPNWAMWGFQPAHMTYLENQQPQYFELYDLASDPQQQHDLSARQPELVAQMRERMLQLKQEMVREGGDWFEE